MFKKAFLFTFILIFISGVTFAATMPVPTGQKIFSYDPVAQPVLSKDPSQAKPIGVGSIAEGGDTLSIHVALSEFAGPVDMYLAISNPSIYPDTIFVVKSECDLQPLSMGLVPRLENTFGPIDEYICGDIPSLYLPSGTYYLYLAVTPAFSLDTYYLWMTYFVVPSYSSQYTLSVNIEGDGTVTSSDGRINCVSDCSEDYISGTEVTLTATPATGWEFSGWSGEYSGTGTCTVTMTSAKSVTATFTEKSSPQCANIAGTWHGTASSEGEVMSVSIYVSQNGCSITGTVDSPQSCIASCGFAYPSFTGNVSGNKFSYIVAKSPWVECEECELICYGVDQGTLSINGNRMYGTGTSEDCEEEDIFYNIYYDFTRSN